MAKYSMVERVENMEAITLPVTSPRNPNHLTSFQAEILAFLCERVEEQARRIDELEKAAAASKSVKGTKKK